MLNAMDVAGLQLFKRLIKDGCRWRGDIVSKKWSEVVFVPPLKEHPAVHEHILVTLAAYEEGVHYEWLNKNEICIC